MISIKPVVKKIELTPHKRPSSKSALIPSPKNEKLTESIMKGNLEPVMSDIKVESIVDINIVNIADIPEEIRPISKYNFDQHDPVDKLLGSELNKFLNIFGSLPIPFRKVKNGIYMFGKTKLNMTIANGNLIVRVGGGFVKLAEFLKLYLPMETTRMKSSNAYKEYMDKVNRVSKGAMDSSSKFVISAKK